MCLYVHLRSHSKGYYQSSVAYFKCCIPPSSPLSSPSSYWLKTTCHPAGGFVIGRQEKACSPTKEYLPRKPVCVVSPRSKKAESYVKLWRYHYRLS